jgi:hypothetical protein
VFLLRRSSRLTHTSSWSNLTAYWSTVCMIFWTGIAINDFPLSNAGRCSWLSCNAYQTKRYGERGTRTFDFQEGQLAVWVWWDFVSRLAANRERLGQDFQRWCLCLWFRSYYLAFLDAAWIDRQPYIFVSGRNTFMYQDLTIQLTSDRQSGQLNSTLTFDPLPFNHLNRLSFPSCPKPKHLVNLLKVTAITTEPIKELHRVSCHSTFPERQLQSELMSSWEHHWVESET